MRCGRFADAGAALSEAASISVALGDSAFAWELLKVDLWAWQDDEERACAMAELIIGELAGSFGAGVADSLARTALTTVHLAHGRYRQALDAAWPLFVDDVPALGNTALPSVVESAIRCGDADAAAAALARLEERATAAGTPWALGVLARARALAAVDEPGAVAHYQESLGHLRRSPVTTELARTQLVYGEWLRRQGRRIDAREQLPAAMDAFAVMGARGFEQRARTEMAATGPSPASARPSAPTT
jgi:hypothetical protein